MDVGAIALAIPIVAIVSSTVLKVARLRAAAATQGVPADVAARLEHMEQEIQALQEQLAETLERLDFTERLITKAREEKRLG